MTQVTCTLLVGLGLEGWPAQFLLLFRNIDLQGDHAPGTAPARPPHTRARARAPARGVVPRVRCAVCAPPTRADAVTRCSSCAEMVDLGLSIS